MLFILYEQKFFLLFFGDTFIRNSVDSFCNIAGNNNVFIGAADSIG